VISLFRVHETTPELAEAMIEKVAQKVHEYGMEVPAVFLLEASKPLALVAGSAVHVATPVLGAIFGNDDPFTDFGNVISDRQMVEKLICRIEELAKEADAKRK
jgi:hypothetical protein